MSNFDDGVLVETILVIARYLYLKVVAASQVRQSQPVTKSPESVPDTRPLTTTEDTDSSTDHTD